MSRSRILLLLAAVAIILVVARFLFSNVPETERPRPEQRAPEVARVMPDRVPNVRVSPTPLQAPQRGPDDDELTAMQRSEQAMEVAAKLRHKARFPPTSHRIEDNYNPLLKTRTVKERLSPPGQGRSPTLVVFASALSYEAPNPIILFARFIRDYPGDWSIRTDAEIAGELVNAADEVVAQVDLRDDGQERDVEAGDGVFTARLEPPGEAVDQWNGLIRVQIYGRTADGEKRSARTRFYYGAPTAKLTGYYRDQLVEGHLQILAEIEVQQAAEYRLEGTLDGSRGLLAWAENTVRLESGIQYMPLTFWGLALREANEPGPYQLSSIALANVSQNPPQLNDAFNPSYQTAAYRPQDFSAERYDDPLLIDKAERHEERARHELQGR
jgi:hypothetical protein